VPILGDIPLLGNAFGTNDDQINRTELLIIIRPRVVRDAEDARRATDEYRSRIKWEGRSTDRLCSCHPCIADAVRHADGGFVLVSVLWLLALLTLVMLALLIAVRVDVRVAGQFVRHAEAEALADGLMRLVALWPYGSATATTVSSAPRD